MATKKKTSPAYAFLHSALKRNPKAEYADLVKRAKTKRVKLAPVLYGKVKLDLGLVKRKAKKRVATKAGRPRKVIGKRSPGRPRKIASLDSIAAQIQELQKDRDRAVAALERIKSVLAGV